MAEAMRRRWAVKQGGVGDENDWAKETRYEESGLKKIGRHGKNRTGTENFPGMDSPSIGVAVIALWLVVWIQSNT